MYDLAATAFMVCFSFRKKGSEADKIFNLNYWWLNDSTKQRIKAVKINLPPLPVMLKLYPYIILQKKEQKVSSQWNSGKRNSTRTDQNLILRPTDKAGQLVTDSSKGSSEHSKAETRLHERWSRVWTTRGCHVSTAPRGTEKLLKEKEKERVIFC